LIVIAAIFVLPLLVAWFMYSGTIEYKPSATKNLGVLVQPPVPLDWEEAIVLAGNSDIPPAAGKVFNEHWVILYPVPDNCDKDCFREVTDLRQIHRASGRQQSRILIALLIRESANPQTVAMLREVYPVFHLISDLSGSVATALAQAAGDNMAIYLIDPLGNIMMAYPSGSDPNDLKQDLKRLLTWSKLDEQS